MSSRLIGQGQALRVASQALPDHPRLHEGKRPAGKVGVVVGPACASAQKPTVSPARKLVAAL